MGKFQCVDCWPVFLGVLSPLLMEGGFWMPSAQVNAEFGISREFPSSNRDNPESTVGGSTRLIFPPPSGDIPNRTTGGSPAGLSPCLSPQQDQTLTALMPNDQLITTVAATPTLFFYIPPQTNVMADLVREAEFFLVDQGGNDVVTPVKVQLPREAGIIKLPLPETIKLEPNQEYHWEFTIICDSVDRSQDLWVEGRLKRTVLNSEVEAQLPGLTRLKQAQLYAQNRIWHETLAIAADLREDNQEPWQQLLQSVGLEKFAEAPFVEIMINNHH